MLVGCHERSEMSVVLCEVWAQGGKELGRFWLSELGGELDLSNVIVLSPSNCKSVTLDGL